MPTAPRSLSPKRPPNGKKDTPPPSKEDLITVLGPNDVLCGRGSGPNDHRGNIAFRALIADRKAEYLATNNRQAKARIAHEIVDHVKEHVDPPGRFLKKVDGNLARTYGFGRGVDVWCCVDEETALEKAKQALRQNRGEYRGEKVSGEGLCSSAGSGGTDVSGGGVGRLGGSIGSKTGSVGSSGSGGGGPNSAHSYTPPPRDYPYSHSSPVPDHLSSGPSIPHPQQPPRGEYLHPTHGHVRPSPVYPMDPHHPQTQMPNMAYGMQRNEPPMNPYNMNDTPPPQQQQQQQQEQQQQLSKQESPSEESSTPQRLPPRTNPGLEAASISDLSLEFNRLSASEIQIEPVPVGQPNQPTYSTAQPPLPSPPAPALHPYQQAAAATGAIVGVTSERSPSRRVHYAESQQVIYQNDYSPHHQGLGPGPRNGLGASGTSIDPIPISEVTVGRSIGSLGDLSCNTKMNFVMNMHSSTDIVSSSPSPSQLKQDEQQQQQQQQQQHPPSQPHPQVGFVGYQHVKTKEPLNDAPPRKDGPTRQLSRGDSLFRNSSRRQSRRVTGVSEMSMSFSELIEPDFALSSRQIVSVPIQEEGEDSNNRGSSSTGGMALEPRSVAVMKDDPDSLRYLGTSSMSIMDALDNSSDTRMSTISFTSDVSAMSGGSVFTADSGRNGGSS